MTKRKENPMQLLSWLGVETDEYGYGVFLGRNVRFLEASCTFQVGKCDFDRWANSVEEEFDLHETKGQRQLRSWVESFKAEKV